MDNIEKIKQHCYKKNGSFNGRTNDKDWWINRNLVDVYDDIFIVTNFLPSNSTLIQRVWHYINKIYEIPTCKLENCNNSVKWYSPSNRYVDYCGSSCAAKGSETSRSITTQRNYGVSNPFQATEIKNKISQKMIERYGVDNYSKTVEFSNSMVERWSSEEYKSNILEKKRVTCQINYGTNSVLESSVVKEKIKKTLVERYGVDSPLKSTALKNKAQQTMIERYGVAHYNQSHLDVEFLKNIEDITWAKDQLAAKSIKEIATENKVSYSHLCKCLRELGIDLTNYSYFEKEVHNFISKIYDGEIISRFKLKNRRELDIYLPNINFAIECDGIYWHSEAAGKKDKLYHINKTKAAATEGIRLVHIFENEWIFKQELVQNTLSHLIGTVSNRVHARSCVIKLVDAREERSFLNDNHLQGYVPSKLCFGAYHENVLIALMSFSKPRYNKKYEWELLRFAIKNSVVVPGIASRLFKKFVNDNAPTNIISYCDLRWFTGDVYRILGFNHIRDSSPNYGYVEKNSTISSRVKYQKHKLPKLLTLYDSNKTEWQNMAMNGYDRIWDCGNGVWVWTK